MKRLAALIFCLLASCNGQPAATQSALVPMRNIPPGGDPPVVQVLEVHTSGLYSVIGGGVGRIYYWTCFENMRESWIRLYEGPTFMPDIGRYLDSNVVYPVWQRVCEVYPHIELACCPIPGDPAGCVPILPEYACLEDSGMTTYTIRISSVIGMDWLTAEFYRNGGLVSWTRCFGDGKLAALKYWLEGVPTGVILGDVYGP